MPDIMPTPDDGIKRTQRPEVKLSLKWNANGHNTYCPMCGIGMEGSIGFAIFADLYVNRICDQCAEMNDPALAYALTVLKASECYSHVVNEKIQNMSS